MSCGFTIYIALVIAGSVAYTLSLRDEYRLDGRGGEGDRREADRHGRNNEPRTEGSASGDFYERFN